MPRTKGATADKFWSDAVRRAVYRETEGDDGKKAKRINLIADKLCKMAMEGDVQAIKEIGDRLEGKPKQTSEVSGPGGGDIPTRLTVQTKIVRPSD